MPSPVTPADTFVPEIDWTREFLSIMERLHDRGEEADYEDYANLANLANNFLEVAKRCVRGTGLCASRAFSGSRP